MAIVVGQRYPARLLGYKDGKRLYAGDCVEGITIGKRYPARLVGYRDGKRLYAASVCLPATSPRIEARLIGYRDGKRLYAWRLPCCASGSSGSGVGSGAGSRAGSGLGSSGSSQGSQAGSESGSQPGSQSGSGSGCNCATLADTLTATVSMACATGSGAFTITRTAPGVCQWLGSWEHNLGTGTILLKYEGGQWVLALDCFAGSPSVSPITGGQCGPVDLLYTIADDPTFCCSFSGTTFTVHVTE